MSAQVRDQNAELVRQPVGNRVEELARRGPAMDQQQGGTLADIAVSHHRSVTQRQALDPAPGVMRSVRLRVGHVVSLPLTVQFSLDRAILI